MKDIFPEYYQPTQKDFDKLWEEAVFVFDANVLLDIYRFSPKASDELLKIIVGLENRIWIPHQFAYEYSSNYANVQNSSYKEYSKLKKDIEGLQSSIISQLQSKLGHFRNRTQLNIVDWVGQVEDIFDKLIETIETLQSEHNERITGEDLPTRISSLFENKVGSEFDNKRLAEILKEGKQRYSQNIPPGYKDEGKDGQLRQYGDLIGWFQIIEFASGNKKPIILVTGDSRSDDWFNHIGGQTNGPRPELIKEMKVKANVGFYLYQTSQFMKHAIEYLDSQVSDETIDEIESLEQISDNDLKVQKAEGIIYPSSESAHINQAKTFRDMIASMPKSARVNQAEMFRDTIASMSAIAHADQAKMFRDTIASMSAIAHADQAEMFRDTIAIIV